MRASDSEDSVAVVAVRDELVSEIISLIPREIPGNEAISSMKRESRTSRSKTALRDEHSTIWEVSVASQVGEFVSDFVRWGFDTLRRGRLEESCEGAVLDTAWAIGYHLTDIPAGIQRTAGHLSEFRTLIR